MSDAVIIADARWLAWRPSAFATLTDRWMVWYLGDDHGLYCRLRELCPARISWGLTGERLNAIAERFTPEFVNLADSFDIADWDWWESRNLAERGPLSSTFTTECCRKILFDECLDAGGQHLFIVEAHDLAAVLLDAARRHGVPVSWIGPTALARMVSRLGRQTKAAMRFARALFRRWRRQRRVIALRRRQPAPWDRLRRCDVLFVAWTKTGDFPVSGLREVAHYMGTMPRQMRDQGVSAGYVALPLDWIEDADAINREVAATSEAAISSDDAITVRALVGAACRAVTIRARPTANTAVAGHSLDAVAAMVFRRERFDWRAVNARLMSEVGPFLARQGCRPHAILHVYENQTWEKGLRSGFRRACPGTQVAGVHQSPFSKLYLNMLPSSREIAEGYWPDVVFTHGTRSIRQLTATGAPGARVIDAGLFRQGAFLRPVSAGGGRPARRLVCATGASFQECCELVSKAAAATALRPGWDLVVNFHPAEPAPFRDGIRAFLASQPTGSAHVRFSEDPVAMLLEGANAVLYADTNAAFEGVSAGAQAINVERDHALSFDKLPDGLARRLYSAEDIAKALDDLDDATGWPDASAVQTALADCFSPMNIDTVIAALGLTGRPDSANAPAPTKVIEP